MCRRKRNRKKKTIKNRPRFKRITNRRSDRCGNPFNLTQHSTGELRKISRKMLKKFPKINPNLQVCYSCRSYKGDRLCNPNMSSNNNVADSIFTGERDEVDGLEHSETEPEQRELRSEREIELENILNGIKEKFSSLANNDPLRKRILTIVPDSWSLRKTASEFNTTTYMASKARELKVSAGVLGEVCATSKYALSDDTIRKVENFYNSDENSRMMPGSKDFKTVIENGQKKKVQKRLLLLNLKELYTTY